jgi:hypothetical protein
MRIFPNFSVFHMFIRSFLLPLLLSVLATLSSAVEITCEAPLQTTCTVVSCGKINAINETVDVVGGEGSWQVYQTVTGFYALTRGISMKFIPSNIFKMMPSLEYFYAHDVDLEELPTDTFKKCSKLHQISLQENKLKTLGQGFAMGCSQTSVLDLSYNQLTELNGNSFKGLSALTALNINYNYIEVINKGTFDTMPALSLISLDMNKISFVHPASFAILTSLNSLVLSNNRIKVVKSAWFGNKTYFERINLRNNDVSAVDPKIFDTWMVTNSNETQTRISYDLNLEGNECINMELRRVSEKTTPYFKNSLNRCFAEYEGNYFYKNFP